MAETFHFGHLLRELIDSIKPNEKIEKDSIDDASDAEFHQYMLEIIKQSDTELRKRTDVSTSEFDNKTPVQIVKEAIAIYPLIINCANLVRISNAIIPDEMNPKHVPSVVQPGAKLSLLGNRDDPGMVQSELSQKFNFSLDFFKSNFDFLAPSAEILHVINVPDHAGSCYIAKVESKKWLVIDFRGSKSKCDWFEDIDFASKPYKLTNPFNKDSSRFKNVHVHAGFLNAIENLSEKHKVFETLDTYRKQLPDYKLVIIGHSLGGAMAAMFGMEAQFIGWNPLVITMGSPLVGFAIDDGDDDATNDASFPDQVAKLFNLTVEKAENTINNLDKVLDLNDAYYLNITSLHDMVPVVPPFSYQRLGGLPFVFHKNTSNFQDKFWPQVLEYDWDVEKLRKENKTSFLTDLLASYSDVTTVFEALLGALLHINFKNDDFKKTEAITKFINRSFDDSAFRELHIFYGLYDIADEDAPEADFLYHQKGLLSFLTG